MYPNNKVIVKSYASELANQYASQLNFRNGILVAGIVTMIIALFGLVGYTSDEVNRRRKEIAIRKVNGAKVKDILRIFLKDIIKIALPCIIVGDLGAWLIARQWLMSFSEKITMTPLLFIGVTIILAMLSIDMPEVTMFTPNVCLATCAVRFSFIPKATPSE